MAMSSWKFSTQLLVGATMVVAVMADPQDEVTSARRTFSIDFVAVKRPQTATPVAAFGATPVPAVGAFGGWSTTPVPSLAASPQVQAPALPGLLPFQESQPLPGAIASAWTVTTTKATTTTAAGLFQKAAAAVPFLSGAQKAVDQAEQAASAKLGEAQKAATAKLAQAEKKAAPIVAQAENKAAPIVAQAEKKAAPIVGQAAKSASTAVTHFTGDSETTPAPSTAAAPSANVINAMAAENAKLQQAQEDKEKLEAMLANVKSQLKKTDKGEVQPLPGAIASATSMEPKALVQISTTQQKEANVKVEISTTQETTEKVMESTTTLQTQLSKEMKTKVKDTVAELISQKMHEKAKAKDDHTNIAAKKLYSTLPDGAVAFQTVPHAPPRRLGLTFAFFGLVALILGMVRFVAMRTRGITPAVQTAGSDVEEGLE